MTEKDMRQLDTSDVDSESSNISPSDVVGKKRISSRIKRRRKADEGSEIQDKESDPIEGISEGELARILGVLKFEGEVDYTSTQQYDMPEYPRISMPEYRTMFMPEYRTMSSDSGSGSEATFETGEHKLDTSDENSKRSNMSKSDVVEKVSEPEFRGGIKSERKAAGGSEIDDKESDPAEIARILDEACVQLRESNFVAAVSTLKYVVENTMEDLLANLLLMECYINLGKNKELENTLKLVKMSSSVHHSAKRVHSILDRMSPFHPPLGVQRIYIPSQFVGPVAGLWSKRAVSPAVIKDLALRFRQRYLDMPCVILLLVASKMYRCQLSPPDRRVERIRSCLHSVWNPGYRIINARKQRAIDFLIICCREMVEDTRAVVATLEDTERKATGESMALAEISRIYRRAGQYEKALKVCQERVALFEKLKLTPATRKAHASALLNLVEAYEGLGQLTEAESHLVTAIQAADAAVENPKDALKISKLSNYLNRVRDKLADELKRNFENVWERKARETIGANGGKIVLPDCSLEIPPGAMETEEHLKIITCPQPQDFPPHLLPITPTMKCGPSMNFKSSVQVSITSWLKARDGEEISAKVMYRKSSGTWHCLGEESLSSNGRMIFHISHFCNYVLAVPVDDAENSGEHAFINDVFIQRTSGMCVSIFFRDRASRAQQEEYFAPRKFDGALALPEELSIQFGSTVHLFCKCETPSGVEMLRGTPSPLLRIDRQFLKRPFTTVYFKPKRTMPNHEGPVLMEYEVIINDEQSLHFPLSVVWSREAGALYNINANNVAMDSGRLQYVSNNAKNEVKVTTRGRTLDEWDDEVNDTTQKRIVRERDGEVTHAAERSNFSARLSRFLKDWTALAIVLAGIILFYVYARVVVMD